MYRLVWTAAFTRSAQRFAQKHPDLRTRFAAVLRDLESDPFQSHLKLHPLSGSLKGLQAVSFTYDYRIILTIEVTEKEIILLNIGSHDEVYR